MTFRLPVPGAARVPRSSTVAAAACAAAVLLALAGCGESAKLPPEAGVGPDPQLPKPNRTLVPTVKIAEATGWTGNGKPVAAGRSLLCPVFTPTAGVG